MTKQRTLFKRVLTILEKALGPDHQNVAYVLEEAGVALSENRKERRGREII